MELIVKRWKVRRETCTQNDNVAVADDDDVRGTLHKSPRPNPGS